MQTDNWPWGRERIIWGFDPSHEFTFKIVEPKKGREGCLSLQYHNRKSEAWLCIRGITWALVIVEGKVCTRVLRPGDTLTIPAGVIHRMMGISDDAQVAEPSTPDRHAADKKVEKDVIRLHCTMGRETTEPRTDEEAALVRTAVAYTEEAISAIEQGKMPVEHEPQFLKGRGAERL